MKPWRSKKSELCSDSGGKETPGKGVSKAGKRGIADVICKCDFCGTQKHVVELWNPDDLFRMYGLKKSYQKTLRSEGRIPFIKIGRLVRYLPEEISRWIRSGDCGNTRSRAVKDELEKTSGRFFNDVD